MRLRKPTESRLKERRIGQRFIPPVFDVVEQLPVQRLESDGSIVDQAVYD
jgi:hypothetical protein